MNFLRRRILTYIIILVITINLIFLLPRLVPGNAAHILSQGSKFAPQMQNLLTQRFGLDQPLSVQYEDFLKNIFLTWPPFFGISYQFYPEPVTYLFSVRIGWTFLLIFSAFILATVISYAMVAISSVRRGGKFEVSSIFTSITFHAIPTYWIAMVLLWVFGAWLAWFPMFGNVSFGVGSGWSYDVSIIQHAVLPVIALSLSLLGENFLLLRGSTQEVLKSDYVTAAKVRGLTDRVVATGYILRNSLLPFVSILTFSFASLISRVVLVEAVFAYPGIGDLIVDAIQNRDYPVLQGSLFFVVLMVVIGGLIGDLILVRLDPKIRKA